MPVTLDAPGAVAPAPHSLQALAEEIIACTACPRLRQHCAREASAPPRRFAGQSYWGRPVPGFGDPEARLLLVGLAPAAHGANRTGRVFTGDRSGDFLYAALWRAGLCNQPRSVHANDGLTLRGVYICSAVRCAPPGNRPTAQERSACRRHLLHELALLPRLRVVVALGRIAHDAYLQALREQGAPVRPSAVPFRHGARHDETGGLPLIDCFHVSQQNTFTGRLTPAMLDEVLAHAKQVAGL
ncbi:MAG: uracil-DNA glycosylase [Myxococcales bacterium]|nr:uracil-DNA glycosylase [Myxococcota bacterium]MDW8280932.1 uracil-DNA glycosylase [Myxococcales bacterium]